MMLNQLYDWKRFWCLRTGRFDLSDGGYLSDPESQLDTIQNPDTVPFTSMAMTPCLVLLSEPGIGKSYTYCIILCKPTVCSSFDPCCIT